MENLCQITEKSPKWQQKIPHAVAQKDKHMTEWSSRHLLVPEAREQRVPKSAVPKRRLELVPFRSHAVIWKVFGASSSPRMLDSVSAHQEDDVGVLVKSSGHTDPLPLTSAQVDALHHNKRGS